MKLLRVGPKVQEKPATLDAGGKLRDLSAVIQDITPQQLTPAGLARLRQIDLGSLPEMAAPSRIGTPFNEVGKFICVGLNYSDHAAESGMAVPSEPVLFNKWNSCLSGPNDPIVMPKNSVKTD